MSAHTAGPWIVESDRTTVSFGGQAVIVAPAPDGAPIAECRANARLIAAAPDLLEALRGMLIHFDSPKRDEWLNDMAFEAAKTSVAQAHAAIAKAEGK